MVRNEIVYGDCLDVLKKLPDGSVNLIVTAPPKAGRNTYGGISSEEYVNWFLPRAEQMFRVLGPAGSFVLNIKEEVDLCTRIRFVIAMVKQGWLWVEQYHWHNKNCAPGKWPNQFCDAHEYFFHLTKAKRFYMDQEAVMVDTDDSAKPIGFEKGVSNWVGHYNPYPSKFSHPATECGNKELIRAFPVSFPEFFIKLFSKPGDLVLDPFVGSGTTCVAAACLGRDYLGIDTDAGYVAASQQRIIDAGQIAVSQG